MGRKKKTVATSHARRMHHLVVELLGELGTQIEIAKRTGLVKQYIHQMVHLDEPDSVAAKGVSADVMQLLLDRLGLDPWYFFATWRPGEKRSYKDYVRLDPTSPEAMARRVRELSEQLQEATQKLLAMRG